MGKYNVDTCFDLKYLANLVIDGQVLEFDDFSRYVYLYIHVMDVCL